MGLGSRMVIRLFSSMLSSFETLSLLRGPRLLVDGGDDAATSPQFLGIIASAALFRRPQRGNLHI
ncbi:uncharacterized protein BDZ83DRAFT_596121 [Colletotrichum acutatum]|uniref:Uncharacterized protein n=1 Tax=Glomerella acutata TaxID=27357 RepID=A0AAD8XQI4_GLOAC|nr:uncharacterized protein BDZ83DRAFT_596121 [Colletotrichum acutatum]KAK1731674.1 hypothetical protein BDZ83DRAFT_596121 [Colletotrichum acutatum]